MKSSNIPWIYYVKGYIKLQEIFPNEIYFSEVLPNANLVFKYGFKTLHCLLLLLLIISNSVVWKDPLKKSKLVFFSNASSPGN